jgi:hypothetical protein
VCLFNVGIKPITLCNTSLTTKRLRHTSLVKFALSLKVVWSCVEVVWSCVGCCESTVELSCGGSVGYVEVVWSLVE